MILDLLARLVPLRAGAAIQSALADRADIDRLEMLVDRLCDVCAERRRVFDTAWGEP